MTETSEKITIYTSRFCGHSWAVERFLKENSIPFNQISIDGDEDARRQVMALNNGFASVPTLIFPDGTQLTEPSFRQLRAKLGMETPGVLEKVRRLIGRGSKQK